MGWTVRDKETENKVEYTANPLQRNLRALTNLAKGPKYFPPNQKKSNTSPEECV